MKKLWVLLLLGLSFPAGAEIVSTISYNPARMGQYDYLKVSKEAVFKGGLEVSTDLNVNSSGTVEMEWDASNANKIYNVPTVTGGANTAVDMPNTTFRGGAALTSNASAYNAANTTVPTTTLEVGLNGGSLSATSKDSYVGTLNGENTYQHYTTNLNANTLNIIDKSGNTVGLTQEDGTYGGSTTYGFHLAGVDIPYPTGSFVQKTGTTALSTTSRLLCWVPRCTKGGKVAWVLSLVANTTSCPASTSNISCTQTTIDSDFVDVDIDLSGCAGPCTRAGSPGHWVKSGKGCCCESDRCGTQEDVTGNRYPCHCVSNAIY
ncbi:MAG: hypothetical protein ACI351_00970 [Candidatus Avelusimicrobium sp.]|uniref:hypothetical protein n=1 Tax=Candidatus Avelusimicrobium sp. TaxID=3048833 RepID=UPI003F055CBB